MTSKSLEPGIQPKSVNITDVCDFVASYPKGSHAREYAGEYAEWMLKAREHEPREYDYLITPSRSRHIRRAIDYLLSLDRRVTTPKN